MLLALVALFQIAGPLESVPNAAQAPAAEPPQIFSGRAKALNVRAVKVDTTIAIDGVLDEPVWARAAVLTQFSSYNPVDGRAAQDSIEVRLWYATDAIHIGVRAWAPPGTVRATLAERDKIANDDWVAISFDTFNDRRRAFTFAVNPIGVQADGILSEQGGMPGVSRAGLQRVDLTQDFVWQSKGRLLDDGFVVEIRVPFKSMRFQLGDGQDWGLQVVRQTQRSGYQDTWAPTSRANQAFQAQAGYLRGMRGMKRGLVLDVTPNAISRVNGSPRGTGWGYSSSAEASTDVRWGVTNNFTVNGTVNPDFSQVETDVGQIPGDVRFALFFPELRPFFVEGSEQFDAPNQLVYTRRIVQPLTAVKLTGKVPRTDIGLLSAVDEAAPNGDGINPVFNILRIRRDIGDQSNAGLLYTDRTAGARFNRVAGTDARFQFRSVYSIESRLFGSATRDAAGRRDGALWEVNTGRTGRSYGYRYGIAAISPGFETQSGFVNRNDFVRTSINQRWTRFGRRGGWWDQQQQFLSANALWTYDDFRKSTRPLEIRGTIDNSFVLRGGWRVNIIPELQSTGFDPRRYARIGTLSATPGDTVAFSVTAERKQLFSTTVSASTPQWRRLGATVATTVGRETEFFETAVVNRRDVEGSVDLRPTPKVRIGALLRYQVFDRARDGTPFSTQFVPRLRVEYQFSRALFLRAIGQAELRRRDDLRDPRTEQPLFFRESNGTWTRRVAVRSLIGRADLLMSYLPSPGTVVFVGYGSAADASATQRPYDAERTSDGLFVKVSYLFRAKGTTPAAASPVR